MISAIYAIPASQVAETCLALAGLFFGSVPLLPSPSDEALQLNAGSACVLDRIGDAGCAVVVVCIPIAIRNTGPFFLLRNTSTPHPVFFSSGFGNGEPASL